jgi:hypothetical protein
MRVMNRTDMHLEIEGNGVEFRAEPAGGNSVAWVRLPAGADLRPALEGLPGGLCQCPHWGYMIAGRLVMHTADGAHEYRAGEAFYWAPGHAPEAVEDCEYVDVSPSEELTRVVRHLQGVSA